MSADSSLSFFVRRRKDSLAISRQTKSVDVRVLLYCYFGGSAAVGFVADAEGGTEVAASRLKVCALP